VVGTPANFTGGTVFDESTVIRVVMQSGTLASYTRAEILAQPELGAYLVGAEVLQARTATLVDTLTYDLSGLLRGRRGTEWAISTHTANERVVVLDEATLNRAPLNTADIDRLAYYKAVTKGRNASTANSEALTFDAVSSQPFSPVRVRGSRSSGDLTVTWLRRTRKSVNVYLGLCPLGEESEAYDLVIYTSNTYATVARTIRVTTTSATYTSAQQTADFGSPQATVYAEVFQISATAGRGYPARKAL
jgi:hypothetical protein